MKNKFLILIILLTLLNLFFYFKHRSHPSPNEIQPIPSNTPPQPEPSHPIPSHIPAPQSSIAPIETPQPKEEASQEVKNFRETADQVFYSIPTIDDLKKLSTEEVHGTPQILLHAGSELGKIAEIIQNNPNLNSEAVHFYEKCAADDGFPSSIRAVCFSHLQKLDPHGNHHHIAPLEIQHLAEDL